MELPNFESMFGYLNENSLYEWDGPWSYRLPKFSDVVKDEPNLLHQYIYCMAYQVEKEIFNTFSGPFTYVPGREVTEKLLAKYWEDKARYLETGELPAE